METRLYYTAPEDSIFESLKAAAISIWSEYGEPYRTDKINRIKDIENREDNFMYMVAMFDFKDQKELAERLPTEVRVAVMLRLLDGGASALTTYPWLSTKAPKLPHSGASGT